LIHFTVAFFTFDSVHERSFDIPLRFDA
jgi:hypothetical protein